MSVRHSRTLFFSAVLLLASSTWLASGAHAQGRGRAGRGQAMLTGTLEVVVVDAPDFRSARHEYFLKDERGRTMYELRFGRLVPGQLRSGMRLSVKGAVSGRRVYVEAVTVEDGGEPAPAPEAMPAETPPAKRALSHSGAARCSSRHTAALVPVGST